MAGQFLYCGSTFCVMLWKNVLARGGAFKTRSRNIRDAIADEYWGKRRKINCSLWCGLYQSLKPPLLCVFTNNATSLWAHFLGSVLAGCLPFAGPGGFGAIKDYTANNRLHNPDYRRVPRKGGDPAGTEILFCECQM